MASLNPSIILKGAMKIHIISSPKYIGILKSKLTIKIMKMLSIFVSISYISFSVLLRANANATRGERDK